MARRTKEDAEKTRQQILDAAAAAFDAEGVAACALEHVARLAGVTRGAIYWHFKNKSDLLDAMLERVRLPQEQVMEDLAAGRITDRRPLDLFHETSRDALSMIVNDERRRLVFRIIFTRIDQAHEQSPLHERQQADRVHFMTLIRQIMARAAEAGDLAPGWTPETAMRVAHAMFHGAVSDMLVLDESRLAGELALYLDAADTLMHTLGSRYDPRLNDGQGCLLRPAPPVGEG
ncbi:TetR family transcriptional regulator [Tistrella mobilis]|uniref:TetR family transcriptional regulator n=1 Tax=Tistrella mobilis TaxID=171437 RepID=UPI003556527B